MLAIVGGVVSSVTVRTGTAVAADLTVRDCLKGIPDSSQPVATVETVACGESHAGEVFAVLNMPDGDFPGEAAIEAYADNCGPAFAGYSPNTITDDSIQLSVLDPTADSSRRAIGRSFAFRRFTRRGRAPSRAEADVEVSRTRAPGLARAAGPLWPITALENVVSTFRRR